MRQPAMEGRDEALTISLSGSLLPRLWNEWRSRERPPGKGAQNVRQVTSCAGRGADIPLELTARDFAFYDTDSQQWIVAGGAYDILVGFSASEIVERVTVTLDGCAVPRIRGSHLHKHLNNCAVSSQPPSGSVDAATCVTLGDMFANVQNCRSQWLRPAQAVVPSEVSLLRSKVGFSLPLGHLGASQARSVMAGSSPKATQP